MNQFFNLFESILPSIFNPGAGSKEVVFDTASDVLPPNVYDLAAYREARRARLQPAAQPTKLA